MASMIWLDRAGAALSASCAVQCAITPVVLGLLPIGALGFLESPAVETVLLVLAMVTAVLSLSVGWFRHRRPGPLGLAVGGATLIGLASFAGELGEVLIPVGALTMGAAHLVNLRASNSCCAPPREASVGVE